MLFSYVRTLRVFNFYGFLQIEYGYIDYFLIRIKGKSYEGHKIRINP